jgi:hypothetical protein
MWFFGCLVLKMGVLEFFDATVGPKAEITERAQKIAAEIA